MMHQPFRHLDELLGVSESHAQAYSAFLRSSIVHPSLADDIHRLEAAERENRDAENVEEVKLQTLMMIQFYCTLLCITGTRPR